VIFHYTQTMNTALLILVSLLTIVAIRLVSKPKKGKKELIVQGVPVKEPEREGETPIYRHIRAKDKLVESVEGIPTVVELARYCAKTHASKPFLGVREVLPDGTRGDFKWRTYAEVFDESVQFAHGIASLGLQPQDKVGVYSANCVEWKVAELACYMHSLIIVSLYDSLGPSAVEFIIQHAGVKIVLCNENLLEKFSQALSSIQPGQISHVIVIPNLISKPKNKDELIEKIKNMGYQVESYADLLEKGKERNQNLVNPTPKDLATIMYTSGTTGEPKGVMSSHGNILGCLAGFKAIDNFTGTYVYLSFLPLAHIMERVGQYSIAYKGGKIAFYSGDIRMLMEDFKKLRPTMVVGVPRIYQRVYDKVMGEIEAGSPVKRLLFKIAYHMKKKSLEEGHTETDTIWDRLVFNKIRASLFGPDIQRLSSGSAPLSATVQEFLKVCITPIIREGYGLTETTAGATMQTDVFKPGDVGPPLPSMEIKLVDVPEMNYSVLDKPFPRGEICIRGPCIFQGYYKDKVKTDEAIDIHGWFHSGDIGRINEDGTISIVDRKKNIFKLSQGEYIAPEYLENVYSRSPLVAQCFVYGDSFQSYLVAVIIPDAEVAKTWANANSKPTELAKLCQDPDFKKAVFEDMKRVGQEAKLMGYEYVQGIHLDNTMWTLETGLLTPTFKLKRVDCYKKYETEIKAMYKKT